HRGPRRNLNPAARRRSVAALAAAFLLLGAMIAAALAIGATGHVRVPRVLGLPRARIEARARALALRPSFTWRHSRSPRGTAISQRPAPGGFVAQGATVKIVLSAGPPPVRVPPVAGQPLAAARAALSRLGLRSRVTVIAAPGVPAGAVTSQSPAPGVDLPRSGVVALQVAETPHWQPLAALHGSAGATTARFHVRGTHWRLVYTMAYQGTCTFVVICSGPTATVNAGPAATNTGATGAGQSFDLSGSGRQTRTFTGGPGDYALTISPGSDTARWSAWLEDWY
ncbi:MAG: PASTA domain-containing protein, partial [Solirubrobacteraceae bacterium]